MDDKQRGVTSVRVAKDSDIDDVVDIALEKLNLNKIFSSDMVSVKFCGQKMKKSDLVISLLAQNDITEDKPLLLLCPQVDDLGVYIELVYHCTCTLQ